MKKLSILLMLLLALGCMTQRRAIHKLDRVQKKFPGLLASDTTFIDSVQVDSVMVTDSILLREESIDTAVVTSLADIIEDLTVENSRLKVQLKTTPSTETNSRTWELTGTCKDDTVYLQRVQYLNRHHYRTVTVTKQVVKGAPWWYYLLSAVVGMALTYFSMKGRSIGELMKALLKGFT